MYSPEEFIADNLKAFGLPDGISGPDFDLLLSLLNALPESSPWWDDPKGVRRVWKERRTRSFDAECHIASLPETATAEHEVEIGEGATIVVGTRRRGSMVHPDAFGTPLDHRVVVLRQRRDGQTGFSVGRAFRETVRSVVGILLVDRVLSWERLTRGVSQAGPLLHPFDHPVTLTCRDEAKGDALDTDCFEEGIGYDAGSMIAGPADSAGFDQSAARIRGLGLLQQDPMRDKIRQAARFYLHGCVATDRGASIVALATCLETLFVTNRSKGIFAAVHKLYGRGSPEAELARDLYSARNEFVHKGRYSLPETKRLRGLALLGGIIREFIGANLGPRAASAC